MKIPQYTKYSGISITQFVPKSLAQIIKKDFSEDALIYVILYALAQGLVNGKC